MNEPIDHAPTPFTADEIRAGCPPGRTVQLLIEPAGGEPQLRMHRFAESDAEGAWYETQDLTMDGTPLGELGRQWVTWAELQSHASFPAEGTEIGEEVLETELGRHACLRYTVRNGEEVRTFWFDRALPGMPIRYATEVGGRVTVTVTMVANAASA